MSKSSHFTFTVLTALLLSAVHSLAIDFVQTNEFTVAGTNAVANETWVSALNADISGTVSNDLFVSAQETLKLNGTFLNDVWGSGNSISASGEFQSSARLLSKMIQLSGTHHDSIILAGETIKIDRTAAIHGDLTCFAATAIIEGQVDGDIQIFSLPILGNVNPTVTLGGSINGDVTVTAQQITVLPNTVITGNLTYTAPNDLVLPASASLTGTLQKTIPAHEAPRLMKDNLVLHFVFGLGALISGLVLAALFPRYTDGAVYALKNSTGLCVLIGLIALGLLPVAGVLLVFTIVGSPLGLLILLSFLILLYLSKVVVACWIGQRILRTPDSGGRNVARPLALGMLTLYIPIAFTAASFITHLVIIIFGLGALLTALFKKPAIVINANELPNNSLS